MFDANDGDLPPELAEVIARYRPGGGENEHKPLLARTCVAVKSMRINQLASAGELLLRSLLQDTMQLGGLVIVDQLVRASGNNALVGVLRDPLLTVVELGVDAVSAEGISDTDAQRVLVSLAQSVSRPLTDPALWAEAALPPMLDSLLGTSPTTNDAAQAVAHLGTEPTDKDAALLLRWILRRAGDGILDGLLKGHTGYTARLGEAEKRLLAQVGALTLPTADGKFKDTVERIGPFMTAAQEVAKLFASGDPDPGKVAEALGKLPQVNADSTIDPELTVLLDRAKGFTPVVAPLKGLAQETCKTYRYDAHLVDATAAMSKSVQALTEASRLLREQKAKEPGNAEALAAATATQTDALTKAATAADRAAAAVQGLSRDPCGVRPAVSALPAALADFKGRLEKSESVEGQEGPLREKADAARAYLDLPALSTKLTAVSTAVAAVTHAPPGAQNALLAGQCAAGTVLAVVAECQALGGCDARDVGDMLAHPEETFDLALCSTKEVDLPDIYARWGKSEDFAASALDILTPPRDADPQSQAVSVTNLVLDLVDLVIVIEGMYEAPPEWVGPLAEVTPIARTVFADALSGDAKGAITTMITFVADKAPSWLGQATATGTRKAAKIAAINGIVEPVEQSIAGFDLTRQNLTDDVDNLVLSLNALCGAPGERCSCRTSGMRHQIHKLEKASAKGDKGKVAAAVSALDVHVEKVRDRNSIRDTGATTAHLLQRAVAFGVFASDFAVASQITDGTERKNAQKEAIRALTRATTDRSRSRGRPVFSVGGTVGPTIGLRYLPGRDPSYVDRDDEHLSVASGPLGGYGALPVRLGLGIGFDHVAKTPKSVGFHFDFTPVELGRLIDWSKDGEATVAVAYPSDAIRFGVTPGITFGRPNVPVLAGAHLWLDPDFQNDAQGGHMSMGAYLFLGFYVPLFDFN